MNLNKSLIRHPHDHQFFYVMVNCVVVERQKKQPRKYINSGVLGEWITHYRQIH
jgi:hypothetical protein